MSTLKVPTNFNIELEFEVPEFHRRLIALLLDMLVEFFYLRIMIKVYSTIADSVSPGGFENIEAIGMLLFLPVLVYHVGMEITMNGQSIGKKIMGLRVVDERGGKASISQFLIRWLLRVSDLWIVFLLFFIASDPTFESFQTVIIVLFGLGFLITDIILVVTTRKGQRTGDILAHTILIRTNTKSDINETVFQEVADNYTPSFPQIMQLSDKDINAIKNILETAKRKVDYQMAENAAYKIKAHLKIDSPMESFEFLETLMKDYNYLSVK